MNATFITSAAALDSHMRIQDTVAFNVANVNTPGFKRRVSATKNRAQSFQELLNVENVPPALPRSFNSIDFSQGDIRQTGNPLDVALNGEGFIKIDTPRGVRYTRNGNFTVTKDGKLAMQNGDPVALKDSGAPLSRTGGQVVITEDGTILQGVTKVGKLDVVNFDKADLDRLIPENGAVFIAPEDVQEKASDATVHQASLEGANVSAVKEFVSMVAIQRNFEAVSRMMQRMDDLVKASLQR